MKQVKGFVQGFVFAFVSIGALPFLLVKSLLEL